MKNATQFLLLSVLVTAGASFASAQDRMFGGGITDQCLDSANSHAALWKSQGINATVVERQYQALLAICSGDDNLTAAFIGAANFDYTRFARMVAKDQITPNLYVALFRDRNRKLRLARNNPIWIQEYAKGDTDGDLVPDSMDRCPGTPDLTPTTDEGCTLGGDLPPAPSAHDLHLALNSINMITSKNCDGAPAPEASSPIKFGYDDQAKQSMWNPFSGQIVGSFAFAVTPVTNQPAACPVFYEVEVRYSQPFVSGTPDQVFNLVFRNTENQDLKFDPARMVFRAPYNAPAQFGQMFQAGLKYWYLACEVRVRTMNGNGLSSGWGAKYRATWAPPSPPLSRFYFNEP